MAQLRRTRMANGAPAPFPQTSMVVAGPEGAVSLDDFGPVKLIDFHSPEPRFVSDQANSGCPYLDGVPGYCEGGTVPGSPPDLFRALGHDEKIIYRYLEDAYHHEWGDRDGS